MDKFWKFAKSTQDDAYKIDFDDSDFVTVAVPHDYAIDGPFAEENDKQFEKIVADGINKPMVHVGRTGGLPITDWAWYRKEFFVDAATKNVFLEFDGIMSNSTVYVNGIKVGGHIYGYTSFCVDATSACNFGATNLVAVSVRPEGHASRWYTGAGIYRNVRLVQKGDAYFPYQAIFVRPTVRGKRAEIDFDINIIAAEEYILEVEICDQSNNIVASQKFISNKAKFSGQIALDNYHLWEVLNAYLYTFTAKLHVKGKNSDTTATKFGIRTIKYDANKGLFINDKYIKLNGVCMHHDLGAIGAAVNISAIRRQLEKLIDIGTNAIRFSHNPPSPEYLDMCDEYGLLTMDEAFDEWELHKLKNSYAKHFKQEAIADMTAMVCRDRNHPSVLMWSIGNEILEQKLIYGWKYAKFFNDICHAHDYTRPTTAGFNNTETAFINGLTAEVDIVGVNYKPHQYDRFHQIYPDAVLYGSETASALSSRGHYYFPVKYPSIAPNAPDLQASSYDLLGRPWSYYPEREFFVQKKYKYLLGEFVWTGFDYLGEPSPYHSDWPSRSSYFGIYDLAGLKKDRAYAYMSAWTNKKFVHVLPHWNWNEGDVIDIHCYTHAHAAELFVNGVSHDIQHKDENDELLSNRLIWTDIVFAPGQIMVVADDGLSTTIKTAEAPAKLRVTAETASIAATGDDFAYFEVDVLDAAGNICPHANTRVVFSVSGGEYVASDAGDATSTRIFAQPYCEAFHGKLIAIAKSSDAGRLTLTASADGLASDSCSIDVVSLEV